MNAEEARKIVAKCRNHDKNHQCENSQDVLYCEGYLAALEGPEFSELLDALGLMVSQHCFVSDGSYLDSMALSTNADAIRLLAKHGRLVIKKEYGRRVIAAFRKGW